MKISTCMLLILVSIIAINSFAQSDKNKEKEKPPTQKEMEEMMKEAEKMMGEMSAADKKMMDSMGIKMPSFKNIPKVTAKQLADAWEVENLIVPKKDAVRINAISKIPLTANNVGTFVSGIHTKTMGLLWPASKSLGEKLYAQLKASGKNSNVIGNTAAGLWIMGRPQPSLYIMGRICSEDPSNTDNLSNYASMLSMVGVQQSAIPVLNYLNDKFPGNSTLLNNLGQAWFGLGDMIKAQKYLDDAIRIYAFHPQANFTKSFIEEDNGNKAEAVNLVKKSMLHTYSEEKEERLRKLGYKLTSNDVSLPRNTKADGLNLGGSEPPPFPMSVDECIALEPIWKAYVQQLKEKAAGLKKIYLTAEQVAADKQQKRINTDINIIKASMAAGSPQGIITPVPLHAKAAYIKLNQVMDEYRRKTEELGKKTAAYFSGLGQKAKKEYDQEMTKLREEDLEQTGEGKPNKDFCPRYKAASDKYIRMHNSAMEGFFKEYLEIQKKYLNESVYCQMYSEWPEKFEAYKIAAQISWLGALGAEPPLKFESVTQFKCAPPVQSKGGKLSNFDDVACKYHSEITLIFGKMKSDCSRFTTEVDLGAVKLGLKQDMDKKTFADQFMSCNVEIGIKAGKDIKIGPLSVETSAGGRVGIEIDRTGVKDVYITGGVKAGAGTHVIGDAADAAGTPSSVLGQGVSDLSIDGGIEGKISLVSGKGSIYGTGIFQK
jgi:tetratricopeptide (TPR) repeat protein